MCDGENIIVEVDPGLDDAYGLAVLVGAQKMGIVNILAVICSVGNVSRDQACKNLLQVLHVLNFTSVQVYEGSEYPINRPPCFIASWGPRGMGSLPKASDCGTDIIVGPLSEFGYFLEGEMKKYKGTITLIVMAPLTTTATLMLLNSKLNFKQIWVMGGNALCSNKIESKFHWDPEAAFSVFKYSPVPLTLATIDLTRSIKISMRWREFKLGRVSTPFMHMMNDAEKPDLSDKNDVDPWYMDDAVLAVAFVFPEIIQTVKRYDITINIDETVNGSGLVMPSKGSCSHNNVRMIESINGKRYRKRLLTVLSKC